MGLPGDQKEKKYINEKIYINEIQERKMRLMKWREQENKDESNNKV